MRPAIRRSPAIVRWDSNRIAPVCSAVPADPPTASELTERGDALLEEIRESRANVAEFPGALNGELLRFRDRFDKLIRESEVDNYRQIRIFLRDVDDIAADLQKAAREHRLAPRHVRVFDAVLGKARRRDFYGARKAWRKLDKVVDQAAEVRRLQTEYRDLYRGTEARIRDLRKRMEHLEKVPKPPASPADANAFVAEVEALNAALTLAYLDFLSRARSDMAIPLLLDTGQSGGIGIPSPPPGTDPEPLLRLLAGAGPGHDELRGRSFYGLLELPSYSDAKLAHVFGDSRLVRGSIEAALPWLKAVRDDERRSLSILWSDDVGVLRRRVPSLVAFLARIRPPNDAEARARAIEAAMTSGRFTLLQTAARLYATHRGDAERKWAGLLEKDIEAMRREAAALATALKKLPDPEKVEAGAED